MWYVYILRSQVDQSCYTGCTSDLKKRMQDHRFHQTKTTAKKSPYKLVWYAGFEEKEKAYTFEKYLKSSSGFAFRNKHLI